jgi:hypothetical protein
MFRRRSNHRDHHAKRLRPAAQSNLERDRLRQVLLQQSSRHGTTVAEVALQARVDAAIAIATAEAAFTLLRRKNLISAGEIDRALADSYRDAAAYLQARGMLAMPGASIPPH